MPRVIRLIYIYIVMSFLIALSFPFPLEREYFVRDLFISGLKMLVYKRRDLFDAESTIEIEETPSSAVGQ